MDRHTATQLDLDIKARMARVFHALMAAEGHTQSSLARASGVSQKTISSMLAREFAPKLHTVAQLASVFDLEGWHVWTDEALQAIQTRPDAPAKEINRLLSVERSEKRTHDNHYSMR